MGESFLSLLESFVISVQRSFSKPAGPSPSPEWSLGRNLDTGDPFSLGAKALSTHSYILGSTGCGKTSLVLKLLERDIREGHTVAVLDLRGDLVAGALSLCERLGVAESRMTLLDLREKERIVGFDPLHGAGEPYVRALHLLDVLAAESESWGVQLEETLRCSLLLLAHAGEPITKLEAALYDQSFRLKCLSRCSDEAILGFWERFEEMGRDRQASFAQPVMNKVTPLLAVPSLRQVLSGKPGVDLGDLLNRRGQVFLVSLAVDELHRSSRMLGSLLVSAIAREMMARVNLAQSKRIPVRLYVDEFENMASSQFEGLIAEGRRFNLSLVLSHQTLSQLQSRLRSVIRNNVGLQVIFQCGFEDAKSVAKELPGELDFGDIQALEVGQAFVLRRDGTAEVVQFDAPATPRSRDLVAAYRERLLAKFPKAGTTPPPKPAPPPSGPSKPDPGSWL